MRGLLYDWSFIPLVLGLIISLTATIFLRVTFIKYNRKLSARGVTAENAALKILNYAGIYDVSIGRIRGSLTDHYNPKNKELNLSGSVYGKSTIAAIGVAAHESGHAIQHAQNYPLLALRSAAVPVANIGSYISWPLFVLGMITGTPNLAYAGIIAFSFVVVFQLITLPVEINASLRAIRVLNECGILYDDELPGAKKVLFAAAMTYVAALLTSLLQLIRLVTVVNGGRRR